MVVMEAINPVFIDGRVVEPGSMFSCSLDFSKKLLDGKSAKLVESKTAVKSTKKGTKSKIEETVKNEL